MTLQAFVLVVGVAAALLAMWVYARSGYAPGSIAATFAHAAGAFLIMRLIPLGARLMVGGTDAAARKLAAVFVVVLPGMVYVWLASIWLIKLAQRDTFRVR